MWATLAIIVALLVGTILGIVVGINMASTNRVVESTTTRHTKEFNRAMRDVETRLDALPELMVDAVREAFPQLYDGPKP